MKVRYDDKEDILTIILDHKKIDDTYEIENSLVSVTKQGEPVMVDIFEASKFFKEESRVLPREIPPYLATSFFTAIRRRRRGAIGRRASKQKFFFPFEA